MRIIRLPQFKRMWKKLPEPVLTRARKSVKLLINDRTHPSLYLKRFQGRPEYWEVRVDRNHRILCMLEEDLLILVAIGKHNMLDRF